MHTDPDLLCLLALGESAGTEHDLTHTRSCSDCVEELAQFDRLVALARSSDPAEVALVAPSPTVWARIRDDLDLAQRVGLPGRRPMLQPSDSDQPTQADARTLNTAPQDENDLFAHAQLTSMAMDWSDASGEATLATDEHGRRLLELTLHADLPDTGIRQAWLVHHSKATQRQTLGILDGPHGLWTVDHSIDLQQYPILDITQQDTGQTEHSGQTIVRGRLVLTY